MRCDLFCYWVCVIAALRFAAWVWFVLIDFMLVVVCGSCWFWWLLLGFVWFCMFIALVNLVV